MTPSLVRKYLFVMLIYALLLTGALLTVFPFFWMFLTSFKPLSEIYRLRLLPQNPTIVNYVQILNTSLFTRWFINSVIVAACTTLSMVGLSALAGYTFAKMEFPGKSLIFAVILGTMFIPTELLVIPWYDMSVHLGWVDTYWGIMFPGLIHAFGVFMMRQFFFSLPDELLDAGRIEGLSEFGVFLHIALPLMRPAVASLAIFNFVGNWNAFLWPVIVASRKEMFTLPVGLAMFSGEAGPQWNLITAASALTTFPSIIVFLIFQRAIIENIAMSGLKG